jgi:hypothetical protein
MAFEGLDSYTTGCEIGQCSHNHHRVAIIFVGITLQSAARANGVITMPGCVIVEKRLIIPPL